MSTDTAKHQILFRLPLEPYRSRYTEQLRDWETQAFQNFDQRFIERPDADQRMLNIETGEVLDALERPRAALYQSSELIKELSSPYVRSNPNMPKIWISDFYHPGLDTLAYSRLPFKAYSFLWAQSVDIHDFTARHHLSWMPSWEAMALNIYSKVFVASSLLRELLFARFPFAQNIEVVGLPFSPSKAMELFTDFIQGAESYRSRIYDVVWTSRLDVEKNFSMFMQLVNMNPEKRFAVCTGHAELRGTDPACLDLQQQRVPENLDIHTGLTKAKYYKLLSQSKVQFNAADQDWVSFTLLEALLYGCLPVYPATRSFTEELNMIFMYQHKNVEDANSLINYFVSPEGFKHIHELPGYGRMRSRLLTKHGNALKKIAEIIEKDNQ